MKSSIGFLAIAVSVLLTSGTASAANCTAEDFANAIDQSGAALRVYNREAQPRLQERMRRYAEVKKLPANGYEDTALEAIEDAKLDALDTRSGDLVLRIDTLGRVPDGTTPDCAKLEEIKTAGRELLTIMKEKSDYMLARLDAKIAAAGGAGAAAKDAAVNPAPAPEKAAAAPVEKPAAEKSADKAQLEKPSASAQKPGQSWSAATKPSDAYVAAPTGAATPAVPGVISPSDDGYSIEEIRDATRGFFGTISTNLASVIEHAFKTTGRPSAYVLGTEGGGAFLAGLRFGQGTLYMRNMPGTRPVYWHGPSLGTDFGAAGSRTMFLIYKMQQPEALFRTFTGLDGSAYFVGGVGVTLLKGGDVIMAPIRTGLGFRLGANLGYLRFVDKPTWNPF
jgi:hypothetical protein